MDSNKDYELRYNTRDITKKRQRAAAKESDRRRLKKRRPEIPVTTSITAAGATIHVGARRVVTLSPTTVSEIQKRCYKIRMATKSIALRKRFMRILVISVWAWLAPRQRFAQATMRNLQVAMKRAFCCASFKAGNSQLASASSAPP